MSVFFRSLLVTVPVTVTVLDVFGYVAKVEGVSMQPVLNPEEQSSSDYVFLSKWAVRNFEVERGDIVALVSPKDPDQKIIKRVVALQGDVILTLGYRTKYVKVPQGHLWVEGDHTGNSLDSNSFGPANLGLVTAKATHIVWPIKRMQRLVSSMPRQPITFGKQNHLKQ